MAKVVGRQKWLCQGLRPDCANSIRQIQKISTVNGKIEAVDIRDERVALLRAAEWLSSWRHISLTETVRKKMALKQERYKTSTLACSQFLEKEDWRRASQ